MLLSQAMNPSHKGEENHWAVHANYRHLPSIGCILETALHLCICESWAAKGRRFQHPPWLGSWRMCGTAMEMKIISDNQRLILELAALSGKLFFWRWMAKSGLHCCTEAGTFLCLQPAARRCLSSNRYKKSVSDSNEFVPVDKKSHLQGYFYETEQGWSSWKSQEVCHGHCPYWEMAVTSPGQRHRHAEPHQKCGGDFSHRYNFWHRRQDSHHGEDAF